MLCQCVRNQLHHKCVLLCFPQHLLPLLARPDSWDVLIAHYLGVDHAGHTYGVNSRQMEDKLAQMDEQVSTVIGEYPAKAPRMSHINYYQHWEALP